MADASQHACAGSQDYCWSSATVNVARMDNKYNPINNSNINNSNYKQLTASTGSVSRGRIIYTSLVLAPYSPQLPVELIVPVPSRQSPSLWGPQQHQNTALSVLCLGLHILQRH